MTMSKIRALLAACLIACLSACGGSSEPQKQTAVADGSQVLNIYNWPDYVAEDTVRNFETETGIKVNYQVYSSVDAMMSQLAITPDAFDLVFPSAQPFAKQMIERGDLQALDKSQLGNARNLDPSIMAEIARIDPGNTHVVPYLWGTTGIGVNVGKVKAALGNDAALDTWSLLFDPQIAQKLSNCGIGILDDSHETFAAILMWKGKAPDDYSEASTEEVKQAYGAIRPYIRRVTDSSQLIDGLAAGNLCVALLYSGDVAQAKDKASGTSPTEVTELRYVIPREGALRWVDVAAIPKNAKNVANAHRFLQYLMEPKTIADITNAMSYANANTASTPMIESFISNDPGIYPPAEVREKLRTAQQPTDAETARRKGTWEKMINGL